MSPKCFRIKMKGNSTMNNAIQCRKTDLKIFYQTPL